jgi:hypothetical protein
MLRVLSLTAAGMAAIILVVLVLLVGQLSAVIGKHGPTLRRPRF